MEDQISTWVQTVKPFYLNGFKSLNSSLVLNSVVRYWVFSISFEVVSSLWELKSGLISIKQQIQSGLPLEAVTHSIFTCCYQIPHPVSLILFLLFTKTKSYTFTIASVSIPLGKFWFSSLVWEKHILTQLFFLITKKSHKTKFRRFQSSSPQEAKALMTANTWAITGTTYHSKVKNIYKCKIRAQK